MTSRAGGRWYPPLAQARHRLLDAWQKCCAQGAKVVILHCELDFTPTGAALESISWERPNPITGLPWAAQKLFAVNQFGHPNKLVSSCAPDPIWPEQARVISAQLIAAYSALQSVQENEKSLRLGPTMTERQFQSG